MSTEFGLKVLFYEGRVAFQEPLLWLKQNFCANLEAFKIGDFMVNLVKGILLRKPVGLLAISQLEFEKRLPVIAQSGFHY